MQNWVSSPTGKHPFGVRVWVHILSSVDVINDSRPKGHLCVTFVLFNQTICSVDVWCGDGSCMILNGVRVCFSRRR